MNCLEKLGFYRFLVSVFFGLWLAAPALAANEIRLSQSNDWQLNLTIVENADGSIKPGTHEFSKLKCGGTFNFEGRTSDGRVILRQRINYGRCVQNCQLFLARDYRSYREQCSGRDTGGGEFLVTHVSAPESRPEPITEPASAGSSRDNSGSVVNAIIDAGDPNKYSTTPGNPSCRFFDGFADNGDGTVTDPRNGLIWKRCAEDFEWTGSRCESAKNERMVDWLGAMKIAQNSKFLGFSNWRLPTNEEFSMVVGQSGNDSSSMMDSQRWCANNSTRGGFAASTILAHNVRSYGASYPGAFWALNRYPDGKAANIVDFMGGFNISGSWNNIKTSTNHVRLVRSVGASEGDLIAAKEYKKIDNEIGQWRAEVERNKIEYMKRQEQKKRQAENDRARRAQSAPRGGLRDLIYMDEVKAYMAQCNSGYSDTFERTNLGLYCGGAANGKFSCFQSSSGAANHICN